jgi:hypothetical protein
MRQKFPEELRPNCLLTRYPICFMHGLKSIFNAHDYWHGIPDYLKNHGYDVFDLHTAWRGPNRLRLDLFQTQILKVSESFGKVHLLSHSLGALNALELIQNPFVASKIASITFISPPFEGSPWADLALQIQKCGIKIFLHASESLTQNAVCNLIAKATPAKDILFSTILSNPGKFTLHPILKIQHKLLSKHLLKINQPVENDGLVPLASQLVAKKFGNTVIEFPGDHLQVIGSAPWPKNQKTAHEVYLDHCIFLAEYDVSASN